MANEPSQLKVEKLAEGVTEYRVELTGTARIPFTLSDFELPDCTFTPEANLQWWTSDWGAEWEPQAASAVTGVQISVATGRSSKGAHPFLVVSDSDATLLLAVAWSGNWGISAQLQPNGRLRVTAGLDRPVAHTASANETWVSPSVITAVGKDRDEASRRLTAAVRGRLRLPRPLKTEWNHWWPYEDVEINESVFLANAAAAKQAGLDVAVLDAGWFGESGRSWYDQRGDWQVRNFERFPAGLESLAAQTRKLGIGFGIWMEPEAVGPASSRNFTNADMIARDAAGESLGYVCLGSRPGREFVLSSVRTILRETQAVWLKWDFNLDPGKGCERTDHGHGAEDGLFSHVTWLYRVLDDLREQFPATIFENCSSGGLRWDLGMAAHMDLGFASDPDWPEHALGCRWASSLFFPPEQQLGWCDSEWRGEHPHQSLQAKSGLSRQEVELLAVVSMLGAFGVSQRLADWDQAAIARLRELAEIYRHWVAPRLPGSTLRRLTGQPGRAGAGERHPVFELVDTSGRSLLFCFNLTDQPWAAEVPFEEPATAELLNSLPASYQAGKLCFQLAAGGCAVFAIE